MPSFKNLITQVLKNNFGFSQREIKGFYATLFFMILVLLSTLLINFYDYSNNNKNISTQKLDTIIAQLSKNDTTEQIYSQYATQYVKKKYNKKYDKKEEKYKPTIELYEFNPNEISTEEWEKFGLKPKIAQNIKKYLDKGGKFKIKTDLKKVYGFPDELYEQLEPYINIPNIAKEENQITEKKTKKRITQTFDLNEADTTILKQIKGIGTKTANNIINYRNKLGGFVSKEQLTQIYTLKNKPEIIEELMKWGTLNPDKVKKIYINQISYEELNKHPYFQGKIASVIIRYREQHGKFTKLSDLEKIKIITPEFLQKIALYLSYD
jgi:DNA uptake protein ComE-like DNA-binding protein